MRAAVVAWTMGISQILQMQVIHETGIHTLTVEVHESNIFLVQKKNFFNEILMTTLENFLPMKQLPFKIWKKMG